MIHDEKPIEETKLEADEPNETLRAAIEDVKSSKMSEPDWAKVDDALFARIAREKSAAPKKSNVVVLAVAATLAAAAAGALWMGKSHDDSTTTALQTTPPVADKTIASSLVERRGDGEVLVGGASVSTGHDVFANEHIVAQGVSGVFERPGKVRWLLESGSAVSVERAEGPLVLALEKGSAEAQVVPVPNGEAFAIDVTSNRGNVVRVAVHGTHLRVARVGDHVTVDLTEGVVSVGAPPKRGSTLGELVTAPAHVELDIDDMKLDVRHDAASVRTAVPLSKEAVVTVNEPELLPKPEATAKQAMPTLVSAPAPMPKPAPTDTIAADPNASERVANTVRTFVRSQAMQTSRGVTVIPPKSVAVKLELNDDGYVRTVVFDPPLPPEVQKHITDSLFDPKQTRFVTPADKQVRIDVTID